jgi:hypothetical protein
MQGSWQEISISARARGLQYLSEGLLLAASSRSGSAWTDLVSFFSEGMLPTLDRQSPIRLVGDLFLKIVALAKTGSWTRWHVMGREDHLSVINL